MNRFFRNKKGYDLKEVVKFLAILAGAAIIIIIVISNTKSFGRTIESASKCSGFVGSGQYSQGVCISSSLCGQESIAFGCEKDPGTVCCFGSGGGEAISASCAKNWNDCSKCKVKLVGMELRPVVTKLKENFKVVCKTSVQDAPCVKVEITSDKVGSKTGYCNYVQGQPIHTTDRIFDCVGDYFNDPTKTYTLTCVLQDTGTKDSACCIDEPSVEGNSKRSISIKLE
ncbi:MAG: hypothetical protein V1866_03125 [archaeon]